MERKYRIRFSLHLYSGDLYKGKAVDWGLSKAGEPGNMDLDEEGDETKRRELINKSNGQELITKAISLFRYLNLLD
jgi:hypothetical protein